MCDVCLHFPCLSGCPNASDPLVVHECIHCGADIYEGNDYFNIDGEPWCEECITKARTQAEREE
jgi:hypothetical protein